MPRAYAIEGSQNIASPADTVLGLTAATTVKPGINYLTAGLDASASPVDISLNLTVQRYTAAGTATSVTPRVLDTGNVAAVATAGENHTVEPTYTSNAELLVASFNSRNTYQWYAYPGYELFAAAAATNGLGLFLSHGTDTSLHTATIHFIE
jgi:hypothetical protein